MMKKQEKKRESKPVKKPLFVKTNKGIELHEEYCRCKKCVKMANSVHLFFDN